MYVPADPDRGVASDYASWSVSQQFSMLRGCRRFESFIFCRRCRDGLVRSKGRPIALVNIRCNVSELAQQSKFKPFRAKKALAARIAGAE